ncbi:MAG: Ldh family oxidoreductase [Chloroflexota bacterium]
MAKYSVVKAERMRSLTTGIFAKLGMSQRDADFMGECLTDADLRGVLTHGCRFVPVYYQWIKQGLVNLQPQVKVITEAPATLAYDADNSLGHLVAAQAMRACIERAKQYGIAAATVRNSRHCGAMAYYAQMAVDAGCIGNAITNGGVMMAPHGGIDPTVALNPVAWAAPTGHPWAVNLDMATSVVAGSKVMLAIEKGEMIPPGWAIDKEGNPTEDPHAARTGAMLPLGGYKGFGLAVFLDILSGVLSGGRFGANQGLEPFPIKQNQFSHFFMAIDIAKFLPLDEFKARMDALIERLKAGRVAQGFEAIKLPGEIEWEARQRYSVEGMPYPVSVMEEIERIAAELGVA